MGGGEADCEGLVEGPRNFVGFGGGRGMVAEGDEVEVGGADGGVMLLVFFFFLFFSEREVGKGGFCKCVGGLKGVLVFDFGRLTCVCRRRGWRRRHCCCCYCWWWWKG